MGQYRKREPETWEKRGVGIGGGGVSGDGVNIAKERQEKEGDR